MYPYQIYLSQQFHDLNPILAGEVTSKDCYERIGMQFEHYVIHYILSGKGTFYNASGSYPVHAGQIFLMKPGETTSHRPDTKDPYSLRWIGFDGAMAHRFSELPSVIDAPAGIMENLCDLLDPTRQVACMLSAELLCLYAALFPTQETEKVLDYSRIVMDYVQKNYMNPISVQGIADQLGLHRGYLSRIFHQSTNYTLQQYIINVRITKARQYLTLGYSVEQTAALCGFNSTASFCKTYKKHDDRGLTPHQRRSRASGIQIQFTKDLNKEKK